MPPSGVADERRPRSRLGRSLEPSDPDLSLGARRSQAKPPPPFVDSLFLDFLLVPSKPSKNTPSAPRRGALRREDRTGFESNGGRRTRRSSRPSSQAALVNERKHPRERLHPDDEDEDVAGASNGPTLSYAAGRRQKRTDPENTAVPQKLRFDSATGSWVPVNCWSLHGKSNCAEIRPASSSSTSTEPASSSTPTAHPAVGVGEVASTSSAPSPSSTTATPITDPSAIMSDLPKGWSPEDDARSDLYRVPLIVIAAVILAGIIVGTISMSAISRARKKRKRLDADLEMREAKIAGVTIEGAAASAALGAVSGGGGGSGRFAKLRSRKNKKNKASSKSTRDAQGDLLDENDDLDEHQLSILREKYRANAKAGSLRTRVRKFFIDKRRRRGASVAFAPEATSAASAILRSSHHKEQGQGLDRIDTRSTATTLASADRDHHHDAAEDVDADRRTLASVSGFSSSLAPATSTAALTSSMSMTNSSGTTSKRTSQRLDIPSSSTTTMTTTRSRTTSQSLLSPSRRTLAPLGFDSSDDETGAGDDDVAEDHEPPSVPIVRSRTNDPNIVSPGLPSSSSVSEPRLSQLPAYVQRASMADDSMLPPPPPLVSEDDEEHGRRWADGHLATDDKQALQRLHQMRSSPSSNAEAADAIAEDVGEACTVPVAPEWTEEDDVRAVLAAHERSEPLPALNDVVVVEETFGSSGKDMRDVLPAHISSTNRPSSSSASSLILPPPPPPAPAPSSATMHMPAPPSLFVTYSGTDAFGERGGSDGLESILGVSTPPSSSHPPPALDRDDDDDASVAPSAPPMLDGDDEGVEGAGSEQAERRSMNASPSAPPAWD